MTEIVPIKAEDYAVALASDRPIWTRQPGETNKEWSWFALYRELHPALRSIERVWLEYRKLKEPDQADDLVLTPAPHSLWDMQKKWSWEARVEEWDLYIDLERNATLAQARQDAVMQVAELGKNMRTLAALAIKALFTSIYTRNEDGKIVFKKELSIPAIAKLAEVGAKLERTALGLDEHSGSGPTINIITQQNVISRSNDDSLVTESEDILRELELQRQVVEGEYEPA